MGVGCGRVGVCLVSVVWDFGVVVFLFVLFFCEWCGLYWSDVYSIFVSGDGVGDVIFVWGVGVGVFVEFDGGIDVLWNWVSFGVLWGGLCVVVIMVGVWVFV